MPIWLSLFVGGTDDLSCKIASLVGLKINLVIGGIDNQSCFGRHWLSWFPKKWEWEFHGRILESFGPDGVGNAERNGIIGKCHVDSLQNQRDT